MTESRQYRSEVIGSLLRPGYLKDALRQHEAGEISDAQLSQVEDRAVVDAIALQEACDLDVIADGEMRRLYWFDPLTVSLSGFSSEVTAPVPFTSGAGIQMQTVPLPA